jgi:hypothetical protein
MREVEVLQHDGASHGDLASASMARSGSPRRRTKEIDFLILQKEVQDIMSDSAEQHVATERKTTRLVVSSTKFISC